MVKGDTVWEANVFANIYDLKDIKRALFKGVFDGWSSFNPKRKWAILKSDCGYGVEVLTANLFPTEKEAKKTIAKKVIKDIKEVADFYKKSLKELDRQTKKWQILI